MNGGDHPLRIVRAAPSDAATIRSLAHDFAAHLGTPDALTTTEEGWGELLADDDVTVVIATVGGEPAGYASAVRGRHLWSGRATSTVDDLFVRPHARGAGVGTALLRALAAEHPGRPVRWDVEEGNLRGQRLFLRLGARLQRAVNAWWEP